MRFIFIISVLVCMLACDKPMKKPNNLIPKDDFIEILTQSYLYRSLDKSMMQNKRLDPKAEQAYILQNKGYDWQQFQDSYSYYMLDEKVSKDINDEVLERLKVLEGEDSKAKDIKNTAQKTEQKMKYENTHLDTLKKVKPASENPAIKMLPKLDSSQIKIQE